MNTITRMLARAGSAVGLSGRPRQGFTLIELLIAVGALAFVAVGVAAIFEATGRTVQGGKRVSAFSAYASLIEQQMRADIESMTREGFLVIRNEMADASGDSLSDPNDPLDWIALAEGDTRARPRRIDELMFFSKGQFVSMRETLHPSLTAWSDAARIYYGHGKRTIMPASYNPNNPYYVPTLDDPNNNINAALGYRSAGNPNLFASDWTLLRHVTLLCPPETSTRALTPTPLLGGVPGAAMMDSDTQIALQPAASNIFRALNAVFPTGNVARIRTDAQNPFFSGGLVDIATTSLQEIRSIATTADTWPGGPPGGFPGQAAGADFFDPQSNSGPDGSNEGVDGIYRRHGAGDQYLIERTHAWMSDALPGFSTAQNSRNRTRIHYEPRPTNYVGSLLDASGPWSPDLTSAIRRADQLMLSSSNFLPRCTEFIVEWSFGHTWPSGNPWPPERAGELVWYGMPRLVNGTYVAVPYLSSLIGPPSAWTIPQGQSYTRIDGGVVSGSYNASEAMIHGSVFNATDPYAPLTSYFGYHDPRFNPDTNNDNKLESGGDSITTTIPWPWPKLIRVTLSLADPNDPLIERTFQFVFEVPPAPES